MELDRLLYRTALELEARRRLLGGVLREFGRRTQAGAINGGRRHGVEWVASRRVFRRGLLVRSLRGASKARVKSLRTANDQPTAQGKFKEETPATDERFAGE